ncbi:MAG TPA: hypothetical protein VHL11_18950, partial [Phototrophicaceae bacterium]|nr:hypothetical protein [Phototrophicaceae bacterium]
RQPAAINPNNNKIDTIKTKRDFIFGALSLSCFETAFVKRGTDYRSRFCILQRAMVRWCHPMTGINQNRVGIVR